MDKFAERYVELAITALKRGTHLLKYEPKGKPKFCSFRLSNDELVLVWISGKEEKYLKLSHVSRIIPGQRTPIFQRYLRPEKEYQSFSLIYNGQSLDVICKDKDEAEVWFTGLKALITRARRQRGHAEPISNLVSSEVTSPRALTQGSSPLSSPFGSSHSSQKDVMDTLYHRTPIGSPSKMALEKALSDVILYAVPPKAFLPSKSACGSVHSLSSGGSDGMIKHVKATTLDAFRVSLSSSVSSTSQGSGLDNFDAFGDVFIWGEGTGDGILGGGTERDGSSFPNSTDAYVPRALESTVVLDVQNIACGRRHALLVTRQGEVFSWGEELGGRLGHGVDSDLSHPNLVQCLKSKNFELVACGEYHSCAVTLSGEMYTWGGTTNHLGSLGLKNISNEWLPKKLRAPLEGMHVSSVTCGPWHTALVTSAGQLFTFGDGTFGVLGHGDRSSMLIPKEVESLKGLRTMKVACGVWHTAAVVEVIMGSSNSRNCSSGKLFTWGDGDKGRLGHGNKESKLVPTCINTAIVEPNFCQVACGHSLTVALTTTGHVYSMGSPVYGQLGNPQSDGNLPTRVEGKLTKKFVEEVACGAYHVAVLTSNTEVYTWGKGANGQLGHGDTDDRSSPSLVEALKDKQVKSIACGTNFTTVICLHKWVSSTDQSLCSDCRLPFSFKRKRHNCYNCGLVFCHSCSGKKSLKASMAPNPNKPFRVCDNCFEKLKKVSEIHSSSNNQLSRRGSMNNGSKELIKKSQMMGLNSRSFLGRSSIESSKEVEGRSYKRNKKLFSSSVRVSSIPKGDSQSASINSSKSSNLLFGSSKKFFSVSLPGSRMASRATSPTSRRSSPPRAKTPTPTLFGHSSMKVLNNAKMKNDCRSEEVLKLRAQVGELTRKVQLQDMELENTNKQLKEAIARAGEETAKRIAAKEVMKSLTAQLKEVSKRLPVGVTKNGNSSPYGSSSPSPRDVATATIAQQSNVTTCHENDFNLSSSIAVSDELANDSNCTSQKEGFPSDIPWRNKSRTRPEPISGDEWVEQDEPGVYITLIALPGGFLDLKRVRFSQKRFSERQAEQWWAENRTRVYQQYNVPMNDKTSPAQEVKG